MSGGRCRRPGRAVGGRAEPLARVRRGGRGIDAVFQSLRLLLIGLQGKGVLLGHLGGRRWRGGEAGSIWPTLLPVQFLGLLGTGLTTAFACDLPWYKAPLLVSCLPWDPSPSATWHGMTYQLMTIGCHRCVRDWRFLSEEKAR